jgi:hypothetical protein
MCGGTTAAAAAPSAASAALALVTACTYRLGCTTAAASAGRAGVAHDTPCSCRSVIVGCLATGNGPMARIAISSVSTRCVLPPVTALASASTTASSPGIISRPTTTASSVDGTGRVVDQQVDGHLDGISPCPTGPSTVAGSVATPSLDRPLIDEFDCGT